MCRQDDALLPPCPFCDSYIKHLSHLISSLFFIAKDFKEKKRRLDQSKRANRQVESHPQESTSLRGSSKVTKN